MLAVSQIPSYLSSHYGRWISHISLVDGVCNVYLRSGTSIDRFLLLLRLDQKLFFGQLLDLYGLDRPRNFYRFRLSYVLLSLVNEFRLLVHLPLASDEVTSVAGVYPSANWLEREVWDMFGIFFFNHPDLRRILTDYGFEGFPLRKDFPLSGYSEVRYDEEQKKIVLEPLRLTQEFRYFDFVTPWTDR